jgi:alpha-tubulin suppressor-like RCC1 family protein
VHSCAVTSGGGAKCWGHNGNGRLGDGTLIDRLSPTDVLGLTEGVAEISAVGLHTCALTTEGGVKCWGANALGALGDGTTLDRIAAIDVSGLAHGVAEIGAGGATTCARTRGRGVKCWGWNGNGQLGDGTLLSRSEPVDALGLTSIAAGLGTGNTHGCAVTVGGGAKCWGKNSSGELGDGTLTERHTAVDVVGLTSGISRIVSGEAHSCALTTGGGVKCWGHNSQGKLGDGTTAMRLTAVNVLGLAAGVTQITAGAHHTLCTNGGRRCEMLGIQRSGSDW